MPNVTQLECALCGKRYGAGEVHQLCTEDGRPLWVRYDLEAVGAQLGKTDLAGRERSLWRYWELLPLQRRESMVSLGETMTPVLEMQRLGEVLGMDATVFMPEDTPLINRKECWTAGARTWLVNGLIDDCGKLVAAGGSRSLAGSIYRR